MGLSGAAFGASEGLEQLLARQMLEAKLEEEKRQNAAREEQARRVLEQQGREHQDMMGYRNAALEADERSRRDRANAAGMEDMYKQRNIMDKDADMQAVDAIVGAMPEGPGRRAVALRRRGVNIPETKDLETPEERASREKGEIERAGNIENAQAAARARHRAPDVEWVQDAQGNVHKRAARPGDKPFKEGAVKAAAGGSGEYGEQRAARAAQSVRELMGSVNRWTTGYGANMERLPESDARAFAGQLKTLKGQIAFGELAAMRAASKTGGALGNVSDRELELLSNSIGNLDQYQSPADLKRQLEKAALELDRLSGGSGSSGGPQVGERRMINGQAAQWDGKGWLPVK